MHYFVLIVGLCWVAFVAVWLVSAFSAKRNIHTSWGWGIWLRIIIALGIYFIFREKIYASFFKSHTLPTVNPIIGAIGALLTIIGVTIAIWARLYLGTNWGMPMTLKENRELVTGGPYKYIRHPIYAGMMLAMTGAVLALGLWWLFTVFVVYFLYFIYSATSEEKILAKEFPHEYPAYRKRTQMLIPFIL
jgi:protein-S-isoprenylcysteine O-methyltransferase Ste14